MRIGIDLNNVLRNTLSKIEQIYSKWYVESEMDFDEEFKYEIFSPVTTLSLREHLNFKDEDHLYDFLYKEHTMEIFGPHGTWTGGREKSPAAICRKVAENNDGVELKFGGMEIKLVHFYTLMNV